GDCPATRACPRGRRTRARVVRSAGCSRLGRPASGETDRIARLQHAAESSGFWNGRSWEWLLIVRRRLKQRRPLLVGSSELVGGRLRLVGRRLAGVAGQGGRGVVGRGGGAGPGGGGGGAG